MSTSENAPIACVLDAIPITHRDQHTLLAQQVLSAMQSATELDGGYRFSLANQPDIILKVAEWMTWERHCCPFFHFTLEVENDTVALSLTGRDGVKAFIQTEILSHLREG